MADLDSKLRPPLHALLDPGEELQGLCVATQSGLFKGRMVAIGVTDGRVLVQGLNRKFEPDGPPISLTPDRIVDASAGPVGGDWPNIGRLLMDRAAVELKLRTADGEKLKLMMMRGEGGMLGPLGGGDTQREGVQALGRWFAEHG